jgi:hypothetical protein
MRVTTATVAGFDTGGPSDSVPGLLLPILVRFASAMATIHARF